MTLHAVVGARVTLGAQQLEQPPRGQPLARRTLAVRPQQSIKPRDISPQSRLRLNPPLVAKLDRRTPDRLAHRLPRDPQLANDLADRLFINPERPPDPANRFHRHHPQPRSPKHNQGEHLTIPGVGRYWMLITPRAGSLFHAVFHYPMLQRNLVYTGVTRGKRLMVLVGQRKALAIAVRGARTRRRWSKLRDRLAVTES